MDTIEIEKIKGQISYCPEDGSFAWIKPRTGRTPSVLNIGTKTPEGYIRIVVIRRGYFAHRLAWMLATGAAPKGEIDHINGIRDDNRIINLRDVSHETNQRNVRAARANNKSCATLGVTARKDGRYEVRIRVGGGKRVALGSFKSLEDASGAYEAAKAVHHADAINSAAR